MLRRYRNQNLWGLVDARYTWRQAHGDVDARVAAAAVTVIGRQENAYTGTKSRVVYWIRPGSGSEVRVLVFDARQPAGRFCQAVAGDAAGHPFVLPVKPEEPFPRECTPQVVGEG
jgi:hypothetical protein